MPCHLRSASVVCSLLIAAWLGPALVAEEVEPAKTVLLLVSSAACALSVDGSHVADIGADEPFRLEVAPGEYIVSAVAADGRRWSKVVQVAGAKVIVQIDFSRPDLASSAPAPRITATPPAARLAPVPPSSSTSPARPETSWVQIPAGEFEMGCSEGDAECNPAELPRRHARVSKPFEIMEKLVTVAQFRDWASSSQRRLPKQPKWSTDDAPVVNLTWDEAVAFCSASVGRLPTEIEWEYAARAGSPAARYGEIDAIAWYAGNSDKRAHPVGRQAPNAFSLYDMLGNVWEWNADVFRTAPGPDDTTQGAPDDTRSLRGGSWKNKARQIRVSNRGRLAPDDREDDDGFRCVRDAAVPR